MKVSIQNLTVNTSTKTADLVYDPGGARGFLKKVAADLVRADGSIKSGYLRLTTSPREVSVDAGHLGSGASAATDLIIKLVRDAYGEQASAALQTYLSSTSAKRGSVGKIGTQSFVALVTAMERDSLQSPSAQADKATNTLLGARLGSHRLSTKSLQPVQVQRAPRGVLRPVPVKGSVSNPASTQNNRPSHGGSRTEAHVTLQPEAKGGVASQPPIQQVTTAPDEVQDSDIPDLPASAAPSKSAQDLNELKKSDRFSISLDTEPFTPKQFNLLDTGPHQKLGEAINRQLSERGLHAPRGISKIEVNNEPVYCYFDSTGKARAILPKGSGDVKSQIHVKTIELPQNELASFLEKVVKFEGKQTEYADQAQLNRSFAKAFTIAIADQVGASYSEHSMLAADARKRAGGMRDFLQPIAQGERVAVQFLVGNDPWIAELSLRPGSEFSTLSARNLIDVLSIQLSPLDTPLPQGLLTSEKMAQYAPQGNWDKKSRIWIDKDYSFLRTTTDGSYVKKFSQTGEDRIPNKLEFFEYLLTQEATSPGITNRMLVGTPTADKNKTIGPTGPRTRLRDVNVTEDRLNEFKDAAITAVDDLFTLCRAGFKPPEAKFEHYLMDPNAAQLEIKMIDFRNGKSAGPVNKINFESATGYFILLSTSSLGNGSPEGLSEARKAVIDEIQAHANRRAAEFS